MPKRRANGEGSIYVQKKDKNGKAVMWAASYTDNAGTRRTLYGKTQQKVKDKLKTAIRESDSGFSMDKNKIKFAEWLGEWLGEWLEIYHKPTVRESTYVGNYKRIYQHVIPAFPNVQLKDLRADMLQRYFNERAVSGRLDKILDRETGEYVQKPGGASCSELRKLKSLIFSALKQAVENNIINTNVAQNIKLPKIQKKEVTVLTVSEQKKLEGVAFKDANPFSFCIILALYTGLRIGELTALKIDDLDFEKKEIAIRRSINRISIPGENRTKIIVSEPKTSKGRRIIPIPDCIIDLLRKYIDDRNMIVDALKDRWGNNWIDEGYVFLTRAGKPPEHVPLRILLKRYLKEAGVRYINFHALRHTFATRCIEAGFDIKSLSDILGHTDAKMTLNTYAHALGDQKRDNMNKLIGLFNSNQEEEKKAKNRKIHKCCINAV